MRGLFVGMMALAALLVSGAAFASETTLGAPVPWGMGLQAAGGVIKERIHDLNQMVFWIIVVITIFVGLLLAWVVFRYNAKSNPVPSTTSHHTGLEIAWTLAPVLILLVIAIPSFRLVYFEDRTREADITIQVQGRQWYWNYAFPDNGGFNYDSRPIDAADIRGDQLRNLSVDEPLVIPAGANVRVITQGVDVIHSFFVPSLGVQRYAIPGRTIETWFRAERPGTYYGQCNQICGVNHWNMPIEVRAVPRAEFETWVASARQRFASTMPASEQAVAAAPAAPADAGALTIAELR
ncbi:cytochrome c oxidase subunit II [Rhodovarius lipocyclicus]|uniref:cytochrome c oxidase subunit II n=1 Tax=Rhodovarius lipocyclicus TaxID=268410 RepID=UPI001F1E8641|nr:cytochrome c oxidase subunit II [Rhodovarius lipocyclicus]